MAISETPVTHQRSTVDQNNWIKVEKKRKSWKEDACWDTKTLTDKGSNFQIFRSKILMEIGLKMSQKYLKKRNWLGHRLISANQSHKSKNTAIKQWFKSNSAFTCSLECIHYHYEGLTSCEDEGTEQKPIRNSTEHWKITHSHRVQIRRFSATRICGAYAFCAQYG